MRFVLPDAQTFTAKVTKRGTHAYAAIGRQEFIATSGPDAGSLVSHWVIISQHLTKQAATRAFWTERAYHLHDVTIIKAT